MWKIIEIFKFGCQYFYLIFLFSRENLIMKIGSVPEKFEKNSIEKI
jgi:hypothetical protein